MSRLPLLPDRERPLVFAHRGCSSLAPENTLVAFRKAREVGAPGIELDVHLTREGELVVAHDDNFLRTSPHAAVGARHIEELTRHEISGIDVGSFFDPAFAAERCPRLVDVLKEFCPDLYVDIELKTRKISDDALPIVAVDCLARMGSAVCASVTVSSFNPFALAAFKKAARSQGGAVSRIPTAVIYHVDREVPWFLRRGAGRFLAAVDYVKPHHSLAAARAIMFLARLEKRPTVPWTVDVPALAGELLKRGAAGIITNRPQDYPPHSALRPHAGEVSA